MATLRLRWSTRMHAYTCVTTFFSIFTCQNCEFRLFETKSGESWGPEIGTPNSTHCATKMTETETFVSQDQIFWHWYWKFFPRPNFMKPIPKPFFRDKNFLKPKTEFLRPRLNPKLKLRLSNVFDRFGEVWRRFALEPNLTDRFYRRNLLETDIVLLLPYSEALCIPT